MQVKTINSQTLKQWLQSQECVLVDVREPFEYALENISQATLIPLANLRKDLLPEHKGKKIVIHCRSGKRSHTACEMLLAEDSSLDVYNLKGGILAWSNK